MKKDSKHIDAKHIEHGTIQSYVIGFVLSLLLTFAAFFVVSQSIFSGDTLNFTIAGLCVTQVVVQLLFFLNLGNETNTWNLSAFFFMLLVVGIIVGGSLWIMYNLDYRMMPAMEHTVQMTGTKEVL